MEDDMFALIDRDKDCLVSLEESIRCFESLGFLRDADKAGSNPALAAFVGRPLDHDEFRQVVRSLCAMCVTRLGVVWSVCVEQSLYAVFRLYTSGPDVTVSRDSLVSISRSLADAGEPSASHLSLAAVPEYLDYGAFVDFLLSRWPQLSRARLAALLLPSRSSTPRRSPSNASDAARAYAMAPNSPTSDGPDGGTESEALLALAAALKAQLREWEPLVARADALEAENSVLRGALDAATAEHVTLVDRLRQTAADGEALRAELQKAKSLLQTSPPAPPVLAVPAGDDTLALLRAVCAEWRAAELANGANITKESARLEAEREELRRWRDAIAAREDALVRTDVEAKRRWSEAFARRERQLTRLQQQLEWRELELKAGEASLAARRKAQLERDRTAGDAPLTERRRRLQQLQRLEARFRERERDDASVGKSHD